MKQTPLLVLTATALTSIAAHRLVNFDGGYAAADGAAFGVSDYPAEPDRDFAVNVIGTAKLTAGGAIAKGGPIKVGAEGKGVAQGGAGTIVAYALSAATGDGAIIEALLVRS